MLANSLLTLPLTTNINNQKPQQIVINITTNASKSLLCNTNLKHMVNIHYLKNIGIF